MKYRIIYIACLLLTITLSARAQKETWNWTFGHNAGFSFHPENLQSLPAKGYAGAPDATLHNLPGIFKHSMVTTVISPVTLSDKEGNLLLYSEGKNLYNGKHENIHNILPTGGREAYSTGAFAIPYPGTQNKSIILSKTEGGTYANPDYHMAYTIVQTNESGDLEVLEGPVNFSGYDDRLTNCMGAVKHANRRDWWIIAFGYKFTFYAWLFTPDGVDASQPKAQSGPEGNERFSDNTIGVLRFTPDGKHFILPRASGEPLEYTLYGDFDANTGLFSKYRFLRSKQKYVGEFSPNQKYLYMGGGSDNLMVYDFEEMVQHTERFPSIGGKSYGTEITTYIRNMQLDIFGRIWIGGGTMLNMNVITNPNDPQNPGYYEIENYFGELSTHTSNGLPYFPASFFYQPVKGANSFCMNEPQTFTFDVNKGGGENLLSYTEWDFGDGTPIVRDATFTGTQTQTHTYKKSGTYAVVVRAFRQSDGSEAFQERFEVTVNPCMIPVNPNIHLY